MKRRQSVIRTIVSREGEGRNGFMILHLSMVLGDEFQCSFETFLWGSFPLGRANLLVSRHPGDCSVCVSQPTLGRVRSACVDLSQRPL